MEPIKLHINRLGLVRDSDITITPLMVLSGESGLGKSYVAVLCHYFFDVWLNKKRLNTFFKALQNRGIDFSDQSQALPDKGDALTITKRELEYWLAKDAVSYLAYMLGNDGMSADLEVTLPDVFPEDMTFHFEQELIGINNAEELYHKLNVLNITYRFRDFGIQEESPYSFAFRHAAIKELFGDFNNLDYSFVLPPSRGTYLSEDIDARTGLYKSFITGMRLLEKAQEQPYTISESLAALLRNVIDGEVRKSGDNYIYITHGETMPASAAASSVREIGPLQMMVTKRDISKATVLIEEPEAHLHPLKQQMMADIIATMAQAGASMQITTHSDYFLRRLNDLLRLGILKSRKTDEEYRQFCRKHNIVPELTLDSSILSAYYLERREDGHVTVRLQNSRNGIPFDTFTAVNGKPMTDSSLLYELTADEE